MPLFDKDNVHLGGKKIPLALIAVIVGVIGLLLVRRGVSAGQQPGAGAQVDPGFGAGASGADMSGTLQGISSQIAQLGQELLPLPTGTPAPVPSPTPGPSQAAAFSFVDPSTWYADVLGRTADAGGLANWQRDIAAEGPSRAFANFLMQPETLAHIPGFAVGDPATWYPSLLGRAADPGGLANWQRDIAAEGPQRALANFISQSETQAHLPIDFQPR